VIDVSVLAGASPRLQPVDAYGISAARRELTTHRISTALLATRTGAAYRAEVGNDLALSAAGSHAGVQMLPLATLNPRQYLDWPAELDRTVAAGVVGLRFFPDEQGWTADSEAFQAIAHRVRGRLPLLLPVSQFGDASQIGRATAEIAGPVVLVGGHYSQLGDCLAALKRWPHLYLETSRLGQFRGIETVVSEVGAERLLFGSGAPARPIQAALNAVLAAQVADHEKRAILANNASRLFGLPSPPFELPQPTQATGLIDIHGHVGTLGYPTPVVALADQLTMAAQHGIQLTIASSLRAIVDDAAAGNAEAFDASSSSGNRLLAYVVVNPNDLDGSCRAMDAAYARDLAVGAKLHCSWSGNPTASSASQALLREVARRGRPLKIHVDGSGWAEALATIAAEYPRWNLIIAHGGPGTPSRAGACLVSNSRNVYLELATTFPDLPIVREVVAKVGVERLLFGTDAPLIDPAYVRGIYADAGADLTATTAVAREVFRL
jgi:predicted TIM-barrel fold metal-dependent hydrolase